MTGKKVAVVTPTHNSALHVLQFLKSLKEQTYKNLLVIIVDDGSTDNTSRLITERFPETILLKGDGNLWWAGCTNKGVEYALKDNVDYIFTVNVDVELDGRCIENLVNFAKKNPQTLVGSIVCSIKDKKRVWYYGGYWDRRKGDLKHASGYLSEVGNKVQTPEWLTGMGVLIPSAAFDKVGKYDGQNFPQYFADADFSLRAASAGFTLAVLPKALVYADLSSSWLEKWLQRPSPVFFWNLFISRRSQYSVKKRYTFYKKYWGKGYVKALLKLYFVGLFPLYRLWAALFTKRILGRI
jgi:GT2 family glycosyltransferase